MLDFDYREVRAARAIIDNTRKVFLAADHTKFGRNAMVRLGHIGEIDELFTDRQPPAALADLLAQGDVQLHVVGDDHDTEIESEDEWEINDDLGEPFDNVDEEDIQEISFVGADSNTTHGFYRWVDKALQILPDGSKTAVDVSASYWANGEAMLLFFAYPNFDGGSLIHDPSMKFDEESSPVPITSTDPPPEIPLELTLGASLVGIATIALVLVAMKRR